MAASNSSSRISLDTVRHVAALANLAFDEADLPRLQAEMEDILAYVDLLGEVDTAGVEPLILPIREPNRARPDTPVPGLSRADALRNAPKQVEGLVEVPRILQE